MARRLPQLLLLFTFLPLCWLLFQAVHELGHVTAAVATGGKVENVVLHPLAISRTDVVGSAHLALVVWAGPVVGVVVPLILWGVFKAAGLNWTYLVRFFAGCCLVANGAYLGVGSFGGVGDAGDLIRLGVPAWALWLFGAVTVPLGFYLWNGLGPSFGFGSARGKVDRGAVFVSCGLLVLVVVLEVMLGPAG
jgi:Peptidase M50B-like